MFMEAVLLKQRGLYAEAEVRLKKLVELQPDQVTIKEMLQDVQRKLASERGAPANSLKRKLEELTLPEVNVRDALASDVVNYLRDESRRIDPAKEGVNIVWQVPAETPVKKVSLTLRKVPLGEVLRYVAQAAGLRMRVEPYAVVVTAPEPTVKAPDVPPTE